MIYLLGSKIYLLYQRPIYIIHGERDDVVPPEVVLAFANKHKNTELFWVKGADHRFKNPGEVETIVETTKRILGF